MNEWGIYEKIEWGKIGTKGIYKNVMNRIIFHSLVSFLDIYRGWYMDNDYKNGKKYRQHKG